LLQDLSIESEIGDPSRQILKNVGKIERFIIDQLRTFIRDTFTLPNYCTIVLNGSDKHSSLLDQSMDNFAKQYSKSGSNSELQTPMRSESSIS